MSESIRSGSAGWLNPPIASWKTAAWEPPDARRWLQLGLGAIWLLDAVLQYQSFMFTKAFSQMIGGTAEGNPAVIADPITWTAGIVSHQPTTANAAFATAQLLLAVGIAWRPTAKIALASSIAWAVTVWWLGEGLGGVVAGTANPVSGAPGAVIIYALLAVLLWPADRGGFLRSSFVAGRPLGTQVACMLWLVLWGSLAYSALQADNRTAQALHNLISGMASGEPGWIASIDANVAALLAHRGLQASITLAVVFAIIAVGIFLPVLAARAAIVLAIIVAVAIWVAAQDFGAIFTGSATDPNSGPLLVLLAVAYWPAKPTGPRPASGRNPAFADSGAQPGKQRSLALRAPKGR